MNNPAVTTPIMGTQEQIQELERQIENLRARAVMELKVELSKARNHMVDIEQQIAKLTGGDAAASGKTKKPRVKITVKQVAEAIQGGATNYKAIADRLGCGKSSVVKIIKAEGKRAGITGTGTRSSLVLAVK